MGEEVENDTHLHCFPRLLTHMVMNMIKHCHDAHICRRKKKKNYARTMYRHDYEPVIRMLNTACRVVAWGVMPLLGGGLSISKCSF